LIKTTGGVFVGEACVRDFRLITTTVGDGVDWEEARICPLWLTVMLMLIITTVGVAPDAGVDSGSGEARMWHVCLKLMMLMAAVAVAVGTGMLV
jgi:hypothetical protein